MAFDDDFFTLSIEDHLRTHVSQSGAWDEIEQLDRGDGGDSAFTSDFERDMQLDGEASVGPQGEHLDDLDKKWQHEELRDADYAKKVPYVNSIVPPSWKSGVLGGVAVASPPSDPNNDTLTGVPVSLVYWVGEDQESRPVTITVRPTDYGAAADPPGTRVQRPVARIRWGTKNGESSVDCDIGSGFQFTVCASAVYVDAFMDIGSTDPMRLYAGLGFLAVVPQNPLTRTAYFDGLGSGDEVKNPRAAFSNRIIGFLRSDASSSWTLSFYDITGNLIGEQVILANNYLNQPILLSNDTVEVRVKNNGGPNANARLIYGLL